MSALVCACPECLSEHTSLDTLHAPLGQDAPAWDTNGQLVQGWLCSCDEWIDVVIAEDALIGPGLSDTVRAPAPEWAVA